LQYLEIYNRVSGDKREHAQQLKFSKIYIHVYRNSRKEAIEIGSEIGIYTWRFLP